MEGIRENVKRGRVPGKPGLNTHYHSRAGAEKVVCLTTDCHPPPPGSQDLGQECTGWTAKPSG